jgi:hypothetical protein
MRSIYVFIATAFALSGCTAGLTQMQDTVAKFDQGAHSASIAQMNLLNQVQKAECNRDFYTQAFNLAQGKKGVLDLTAPCTNVELTNTQVEIRQKLMDAITLYADSIQSLANGTGNTNLSTNSKTVASNIQSLATQQGFTTITSTDTAALNAALVSITGMILDHHKYTEIKAAAAANQKELATIVAELKNENTNDSIGLDSKKRSFVNEMKTAVLASRDKLGEASFFNIIYARNNIDLIFPPAENAAQLNKTLDSLVAANQALANAGEGGAIPEVSDLVSRAQQAATLFNSTK